MIAVDADEIATNLWQGGFPEPGDYVRDSGFSMLVLCAEEAQEPAESYPGVEVVYAPNEDGPDLTRERLQTALRASRQVAAAVQANRRVLVTCQAGLNRSGLVVAMALHHIYGWKGAECIDRVRQKRKYRGTRLFPLCNQVFVQALLRLTRRTPASP